MVYTAKEKRDAIGRELVYRRRVYKRLVAQQKMKIEAAMFQIAVFEAIEADYDIEVDGALVKALRNIADLVDSEAGEPLDDAIKFATDALDAVGTPTVERT